MRCRQKVWIDLENSPHVPFFIPIIGELEKRGYSVILTARNCAQVHALVNLHGLHCKRVGRQYGKTTVVKLAGLFLRSLQLIPIIWNARPDLAVSHGSRAQLIVSAVLGIRSLSMDDYEYSKGFAFVHPTWLMCPEVIPETDFACARDRILKYPGIKEDVYVPLFTPDDSIQAKLKFKPGDLIVTLRPPADNAHYHNKESDSLYHAVVDLLDYTTNVKVILLPRREEQATFARKTWPHLFAAGKMVIPEDAVDGLNLIWHSDLVISGGGTMNREAAALGVPVYSIFRGKIGAVDRYLSKQGRLTLIENVEEVRRNILLTKRHRNGAPGNGNRPALQSIVNSIAAILELRH